MVDRASQRVIDYVQLNGLNSYQPLSDEILTTGTGTGVNGLWNTNQSPLGTLSGAPGLVNQIDVSAGVYDSGTEWTSYGVNQLSGNDKQSAINIFRVFLGASPMYNMTTPMVNTNYTQQAPFTPTRQVAQYQSWQANDPLVHYMSGDLADFADNNVSYPSPATSFMQLPNLGVLNNRYNPWGYPLAGDTNAFNPAIKDPQILYPDAWQFPTNKFPNIGWLGRVHRGTPWQTVYLKATDITANLPGPGTYSQVGLQTWTNWTGNANYWDALHTAPVADRSLFDLFTAALDDNASRGQLSVNQTNLAAWSGVLGGVVALPDINHWTNVSPVGLDGPGSPLWQIVNGITRTRANTNLFPQQVFTHTGDILATPELTDHSPFLSTKTNWQNDAVYEWLPEQVMSLLTLGKPRFVIYSYGQALRPAIGSFVMASGPFFGMCTNYQITAETATRAVVRMDPVLIANGLTVTTNYTPVIESFNVLPPE